LNSCKQANELQATGCNHVHKLKKFCPARIH